MKKSTILLTSLVILISMNTAVFAQQLNAPSDTGEAPTLVQPLTTDTATGEQPTLVPPVTTDTATGGHEPGSSGGAGAETGEQPSVVSPTPGTDTATGEKPSIPTQPVIIQPSTTVSDVLPLEEVSLNEVLPIEEVSFSSSGDWEGQVSESGGNVLYIKTAGEVSPQVQSAIDGLQVRPAEIFSPVFSQVTNLVVNPAIEDAKLVYQLNLPADTPIFRENEVVQPIFDLGVDKPVEFKLADNRIIVNKEQVIDYKNIVSGNEVMPPVELKIHSALTDGVIHDMKVIPGPESAKFKFIYRNKEVMMPIYSDFKIENQKISLLHDGQVNDLKVLPPEIYAAVFSALETDEFGKDTEVKDLSIKVEEQKAVYDLKVKEPFKLFWLIPMEINSQYIIDSTDGALIDKNRPWWTFFGKKPSWAINETIGRWKVEIYTEEMD